MSFSVGDTILVANVDGSSSLVVESTNKIIFDDGTNTLEIEPPQYGYTTEVIFPRSYAKDSKQRISVFDAGSAYDKYICKASWLLDESDTNDFVDFFSNLGRAKELALTSTGGYKPFGPNKGVSGPFDIKLIGKPVVEQSGLLKSPWKYFRVSIQFQNVGAFPAYTPPSQETEGDLQIGTITGLRCPDFNPSVDYKIGADSQWGNSVVLTDWNSDADAYNTSFTLTGREGNMAAVIDEIIDNRQSNFTLNAGSKGYIFGRAKGAGPHTGIFSLDRLTLTHVSTNKWTVSLAFQWVS